MDFTVVLTAFGLFLGGFAFLFVRPDIPWEKLRQVYSLAESQFVDIGDGITVHVRDTGPRNAPILVLLHGFGASVHTWIGWTRVLDVRRRVISLDLKGFGLTSAPLGSGMTENDQINLVAKTLDRLEIQHFSLLGHSLGGAIAWRFALAHPTRLTALVLSGAMGKPPAEYQKNLDLYKKLATNPIIKAAIPWLMSRFFIARGMVNGFANPSLATPERIARAEKLSRGTGQRRHLLTMISSLKRDSAHLELSLLTVPTLIMHGVDDKLVPVSAGEALADAIAGAKILLYPGVGHVLQEELVEEGARDLSNFLTQAGV
jgi:pimeloyl-ACP methyl ester carboxylesterase